MLNFEVKDAKPVSPYAAPIMETMGDRIRTLRVAAGLTQEQLGDEVGVSKGAVSHWEAGTTKNIKLGTFLTLLKVLRTDFEYLIFGAERAPAAGSSQKTRGAGRN